MIPFARSLVIVGSLGLATVLTTAVRADTAGAPTTPSTPQTSEQPSAPPAESEGAKAGGGIVQLVDEALSNVQLRKEQTDALQKLAEDVRQAQMPVEQAKKALLAAMIEPIASGRVQEGAVEREIDALVDAVKGAAPTMRAAFEKVHGILDTDQRAAFAMAFDTALRHRITREHKMKWADELGLSDEQRQQIKDIFLEHSGKMDAIVGRLVRVNAFFETDEFKLDDISPLYKVGERTRRFAEVFVHVTGRIVQILTPDQRQRVAEKLKEALKTETPVGTRQGSAGPEQTGATSSPLWGGYRVGGYVGGYRGFSGWGYARGYMGGVGYII